MNENVAIRESLPSDVEALDSLYPDAFPTEDLLPVVHDLLAERAGVLSLVAVLNTTVVGHVIFTRSETSTASEKASLLAPLAVASHVQKQGIGTALVRDGFRRLKASGIMEVFVLGDPAYYCRLGFMTESDIQPPYTLPDEWEGAWQSIRLNGDGQARKGTLVVAPSWRKPDLWAP